MRQLTFERDDVIFREGEFALTMYEIESGSVGIYANYGSPDAVLLATLGQGEYFGEMGLAECYPRSATAVAMEATTTLDEIDADEFATFFQDRPDAVLSIMRALSSRLRQTSAHYIEARQTVHDAIEAEHAGKRKGRSIASKLTDMLGFARRNKKTHFGRS